MPRGQSCHIGIRGVAKDGTPREGRWWWWKSYRARDGACIASLWTLDLSQAWLGDSKRETIDKVAEIIEHLPTMVSLELQVVPCNTAAELADT